MNPSDEHEIEGIVQKFYQNERINLTDKEALGINGLLYPYAMRFKGCKQPIGLNASQIESERGLDVCTAEVSLTGFTWEDFVFKNTFSAKTPISTYFRAPAPKTS